MKGCILILVISTNGCKNVFAQLQKNDGNKIKKTLLDLWANPFHFILNIFIFYFFNGINC